MDENNSNSQTLFPHETGHGHHRSARERQRKGPMWGCLTAMVRIFIVLGLLAIIVVVGIPWIITTTRFEDYVRRRIESTLETRLGREVTIKSISVGRGQLFEPTKIILNDVRIANAPGAVNPYFATVRAVVITGGVGSFRTRTIKVGRIDVIEPRVYFEIFPEGNALTHNFPSWKTGPKKGYEIVHLDLGQLFVRGGAFVFLDRRHDIAAEAVALSADMRVTRAEDLYAGVLTSPKFTLRIQDYVPLVMDLRGGFRYTPGVLALNSIALRGDGIEAFLDGKLDPLTEAKYDLRVRSQMELSRVREIFRVEKLLDGAISLDTRLAGKAGDFHLTGGWISTGIVADTYEIDNPKGKLDVTGNHAIVDVESGRYGGGNIGAHYVLSQYAEPYPMSVQLRYNNVSMEKLFADWGVKDTGLRAGATGNLDYRWNKDKVLEGSGTGTARLSKNATAFSNAKYPIGIAGDTDFALDRGVVRFRRGELDTEKSHVSFTGTLGIEGVVTDLAMQIRSSDFSELDRLAYNFAHSADKKDFELLGLGGAGTITGTVRGPIDKPMVAAHISGTSIAYNNVVLGAGELDIKYDGPKSVLAFERATFTDGNGRLALTGTVAFPDRGPGPRFDIALDAANYPVERAVKAVDLKFALNGMGTGKMIVSGTPDAGKVTFAGMTIRRGDSSLVLGGDVAWQPGEGNIRFNLDIDARDFPVEDVATFFEFKDLPVKGRLTGKLHLEGPKNALEGSGAVTVRNGSIYGEPVDLASANILFTEGKLRATNVTVSAPAGQITGEAEMNLTTNQFSYTIASSSLDLSRLQLLAGMRDLFGGKLVITSTGAGTVDKPEVVLEAKLNEATLRGLNLPPDAPPPSLYIAIRNGRLIVKGSAANVLTIEGDGAVGPNLTVDGLVRIAITDISKLVALSANTATIPAAGNLVVDLKLGGRLTPIDALVVEAVVPTLDLRISGHQFLPARPLRFSLHNGRVTFDDFELRHEQSAFAVSGFAELTGDQRLAVDLKGRVEAALLQLFVADARAGGEVNVALAIGGTVKAPQITGNAELMDVEVAFAGFPQVIDEVNGTLRFSRDRIDIEAIRAKVGGGMVTAGGFVTVEGMSPQRARITLAGTDVALRYFEGLTVEGDFTLLLTGDMDRMVIQGDVNVDRALYFRDFDFQKALLNVILSRRGLTPVVAATWQDRVSLRIHLKAPETLAVRNNIADVTGSANIDLTGTLANPVILGSVELDEGGTVTFQNIDYKVARGTINFQNPFRIDPFFDITLEARVSSSGFSVEVESGPIDLTVNITGTLDRITPTITSDPPASDITLFSLIGLGGLARPSEGTGNAAQQGQNLLIGGVVSGIGQKILPFADSFTYDPGLIDATGSSAAPRVTFEKRVSDDVRLLVVYNMTTHQNKEVVEWAATRDWTLQFTRDEEQHEFRTDARFRRRYQGQWTWGSRGHNDPMLSSGSVNEDAVTATLVPPPQTTNVAPAPAESAISEVRFAADGRFDTSVLKQYVTLRPGEQLTRREVQSTIKSLYGTGNFRDIRIDAAPAPSGSVITISLSLNYRIEGIVFDGLEGSERRSVQRELTVRRGDVHSLNAVDDSAVAIQEELVRSGYLEATVDPESTFVRQENAANVTFYVNKGPLAKVGAVDINGVIAPFTREQLISQMRDKPGRVFKINDARRDANRMRAFLARKEYRRADVDFLGHTYDKSTHTVALRYEAVTGPIVKVEVEGVPRSAVRRLLPFRGDQEYSEDAIEQASQNIVKTYQERGYFNVAVDTESRREDGVWTTTFNVNTGAKYRLTDIQFTGNTNVKKEDLKRVVATAPSSGYRGFIAKLFRRPTGVTRSQLGDDRDALESYYQLQGFSAAKVGAPVPSANADGTLVVTFPITEGPQTMVTQVNMEGIEQVDATALPKLLMQAGMPLNPQTVRQDVVALQTFYADRGNTEVQIRERIDLNEDHTTARVNYVVAEGPRVSVAQVSVGGNTYTSSDLILRKADLDKGEAFSYTKILEAQQNLYRLGIFNRVDVQPQQAGTSLDDRNVAINVEEGRNLTVTGSVGLRAARVVAAQDREVSFRLAGGIAHRNLFGTGRYLGLEAVGTTGGIQEQELYLTYREPYIGRYNIPVQVSIFQSDDATRKETRIVRRGTSIEASKATTNRTRWSLHYQYEVTECLSGLLCSKDFQEVISPGLDRSFLDVAISSVTPTFFWDQRNDVVNPTSGFFTSASVQYAFSFLDADANFVKEFVEGSWYLPVSARTTFAIGARLGYIQPLREDDPDTRDRDEHFIPLSERFTAGGDTSHRAFPLDLLGTLCEDRVAPENGIPDRIGFPGCEATLVDLDLNPGAYRLAPLGGNGVFIMNAEYRFPIAGPVGGAVFGDIGNVFANSIKFDQLRYGAGFGVRYLSPVGPLRVDVGFPVSRRVYEKTFSYSFTLGYAF